ncbi:MAG: DUF177 domain-containing protein [Rhizobiales bacterium]|nr:DUF177 domain-containing protein [Hyphomicrobiales bacterium]
MSPPAARPLIGARVRIAELAADGVSLHLIANEAECAEIAAKLEIDALSGFAARLEMQPWGKGGASVQGELEAHVRQLCVVTLEPVDSDLRVAIDEKFSPAIANQGEVVVDIGDPDDAAPITNGEIEIGELLIDTLSTSLDAYPRAPGAELELAQTEADEGGDEAGDSPFAGLAALKSDPPEK